MGRIYAGKNLERNEKVIVKKLKADKYFNAWGESSCEDYWNREKILIKKQARCSPNAMHLMGAVKRDIEGRTEYFLILEYIAGPSLEKWYHEFLRENTISSLTQIHDLIKLVILPLCNHLKAVHQAGIVHRDITPRNIIMNFRDNRIYPILIDWGVAKEIPLEQLYSVPKPFITEIRTVATGILSVGTPPEIIAGFRPVAASDIYMFGHIIYYLITGNSSRQIPLSQAEYELCPKTVNAVVPVKLDKLVRNMTKYEPADGFHQWNKLNES
jgi:serine/threonine protein kinase